MKRITYILLFIQAVFTMTACNQERQPQHDGFDIVGAWKLARIEYPDGKVDTLDAGGYTRCKIYDADSIYYSIELFADDENVMIIPHEMARYTQNDSIYIENGRVTPLQIINDTTLTTVWNGYLEVFHKVTTMTETRKDEIRDAVRTFFNSNRETGEKITNFVFSTSERKLLSSNQRLLYIIIILVLASIAIVMHYMMTVKRKQQLEQQLRELQEIRNSRPQSVVNAMKEVEDGFFQSEYYLNLRRKIEAKSNFSLNEWEKLEQELKGVYPDFSAALYRIPSISKTEYHVCLLIKVRATPTEIAGVLKKEPSTISSMRGRLYHKVFDKDGGAKEWDEFILSL